MRGVKANPKPKKCTTPTPIRKGTPPSACDLPEDVMLLLSYLSVKRPDDSESEVTFVARLKEDIEETCGRTALEDDVGNLFLMVTTVEVDDPFVMFTAHTDTVHSKPGVNPVLVDTARMEAFKDDGECLGADDGTGCWILLQMIKRGVPGLYCFFRGEEVGGIGSSFAAREHEEILKEMKMCVSFDRKGTGDVITHQGSRCCSDAFALALAGALNEQDESFDYALDPTGVFTDSAQMTHLIPECTNLSVGYYDQHTSRERQDINHALKLVEACCKIDWHALPVERDPSIEEYQSWGVWDDYCDNDSPAPWQLTDFEQMVKRYPDVAAQLLMENGIGYQDFTTAVGEFYGLFDEVKL